MELVLTRNELPIGLYRCREVCCVGWHIVAGCGSVVLTLVQSNAHHPARPRTPLCPTSLPTRGPPLCCMPTIAFLSFVARMCWHKLPKLVDTNYSAKILNS